MKYPGWPRPLSKAKGRRVRALRDIQNRGGDAVRAGTVGTVKRCYSGLDITFDKCAACGSVLHVTKVHPRDVELLPEGSNA